MPALTIQSIKPTAALTPSYVAADANGHTIVDANGVPWPSASRTLVHVKATSTPLTLGMRWAALTQDLQSWAVPAGEERFVGLLQEERPREEVPPPPTIVQIAGGSLSARTYSGRLAYVRDGSVYGFGPELPFDLDANKLIRVQSPPTMSGYDGWVPVLSSSPGLEVFQPGQPATPVAFGTTWTEPSGGATLTGTPAAAQRRGLVLTYSAVTGVTIAAFDVLAGVGA
jgi:hypothetical protein